jgi:hypothetical protein
MGAAPLALALLVATSAGAGILHGTVSMREPVPGSERMDPTQAVIWLEAIPGRIESGLARGPSPGWFRRRVPEPPPVLVQSELRFHPPVVTLVAGGRLVVRNQDAVWHGAFSVSPVDVFDLGKRPPGRADTVRLANPGIVLVRCDIHPEMSASVVVTPNHARARPDANGRWRLPNLPPGRYVVRAWAPGRAELRHAVNLPRWGRVPLAIRW